jgi:hypothetical protein
VAPRDITLASIASGLTVTLAGGCFVASAYAWESFAAPIVAVSAGGGRYTGTVTASNDTSVTVTWSGSSTLSTDSGDYPMDLDINGERVTVSTAPAGSTSPQSLILSARGVAPTVARSHGSGEPVEVWDAGRFTARPSFTDGGVG